MALLLSLMLLLLPFAFSLPAQAEENHPVADENPDAGETPATPETTINPAVPNTDPNIPETPENPGTGFEVPESPVNNELIPRNFSNAPLLMPSGSDDVPIDKEHFPDPTFRSYLQRNFDEDKDGIFSQDELDKVTIIRVGGFNTKITNLKGVELFRNLEELYCFFNSLTTLDVSQNLKLKVLECGLNQLSNLDVSNNLQLERLLCGHNPLGTLDVSKNSKLKTLGCSQNGLSQLDLSHNSSLKELYCWENQLTELDLSHNPELTVLSCEKNSLATINLTNVTHLTNIDCKINQLTTLDVSQNTSLDRLECSQNQLSQLDLKNNKTLFSLLCKSNQLSTLDLKNNGKLSFLTADNNYLTSLDCSENNLWMKFSADNQTYNIKVDINTLEFDLRSLPGIFNPAMASEWVGAEVEPGSTILKLDSSRPQTVTYIYDSNIKDANWEGWSDFNVTLYVTYIETPPQPKDILIPCPYGAVICPTQPAYQTNPLTPVPTPIPVQQKTADDIQAQVAQLPKTGAQEPMAVAFSSLLLLSLGAFLIISRKK